MSEPCKHEREFAGTQQDTLTSFVKSNGELVKMTAERNAAKATLARVQAMAATVHLLALKAAGDALAGYRGADGYADAYQNAERLIRAALEPTPKGKP